MSACVEPFSFVSSTEFFAMTETVLSTSIEGIHKIAEGKVRDLYEVDEHTLLFVASDRISAYDVIMKNVISTIVLFNFY